MRKIISVLLAAIMTISVLSGCGHTHEFGEWEEEKAATFTKSGTKVRYCSCGEKEEETIPKRKAETTELSSTEAQKALREVYESSVQQESVWFEEEDSIRACYVDADKTFLYYCSTERQNTIEQWYGFVDDAYIHFSITTAASKTDGILEQTTAEAITEAALLLKTDVMQYLENTIDMLEGAEHVDCIQITTDTVAYEITLTFDGETKQFTVTTTDGLITEYLHDDIKATYEYGVAFAVPNMEDFEAGGDDDDPIVSDPTEPSGRPDDRPNNNPTEPTEPSEPEKPSTEVEQNYIYIHTFGSLDVALTSGSVGNLQPVSGWKNALDLSDGYGLFCFGLGMSSLVDEHCIPSGAILQIPIYGSDGRVQELAAITQCGTMKQKRFRVSDAYGVRAIGVAQTDYLEDVYGYIVDLAFRTQADQAPLKLQNSYIALRTDLRDHDTREQMLEYAQAIEVVFFDTVAGTVLTKAHLNTEGYNTLDDGVQLELTLDNPHISLLSADETARISVLVYVDGTKVMNNLVGSIYIHWIDMTLGFAAEN